MNFTVQRNYWALPNSCLANQHHNSVPVSTTYELHMSCLESFSVFVTFFVLRCAYYQGAVGKGQTIEIYCTKEVRGRYVYVMLRGSDYLTLCEVEVFGIQGGMYTLKHWVRISQ